MSATVLADTIRRAAHDKHRCAWCGSCIDKGERYRDLRIADDGLVRTWREHPRCMSFVSEHLESWEFDYIVDPRVTFNDLVHDFGPPSAGTNGEPA